MNKGKELFLEEFNRKIRECEKFCFMSRGKEFQQECIKKLILFKQKVNSFKKKAIESEDEEFANYMLSLEYLIEAIVEELKMWVALKEDRPSDAWDSLINAQLSVRRAAQAHSIAVDFNVEGYANKLYLLEKLLFPPQVFLSPSFIIEKAECSICGKEYGECEHVVGKAYKGKMCYRIIKGIKGVKEVSIVEKPANKRARVFLITDDDGITRDFMTWREIRK